VAHKLVRNVRNDEQAGIVLPFGWEFELVSTGGSRQFDTDKIVQRYEKRMLMAALAQFIMLGQDGVGSLALSKDMSDFFTMAVNAMADIISETFTKHAIPRLLKLNGYDAEGVCLEHTLAGDVDIAALVDAIQKAGAYITWDAADELWLRQTIGMPEKDIAELQEQRDAEQEMKDAQAKAILAEMNQNKKDGEDMPMDEKEKPEDEQEGYAVTRFAEERYASNAPDDAKRRRMERKLQAAIEQHMARTKKKVMKYAKEVRR
jgi:hypothetical protein